MIFSNSLTRLSGAWKESLSLWAPQHLKTFFLLTLHSTKQFYNNWQAHSHFLAWHGALKNQNLVSAVIGLIFFALIFIVVIPWRVHAAAAWFLAFVTQFFLLAQRSSLEEKSVKNFLGLSAQTAFFVGSCYLLLFPGLVHTQPNWVVFFLFAISLTCLCTRAYDRGKLLAAFLGLSLISLVWWYCYPADLLAFGDFIKTAISFLYTNFFRPVLCLITLSAHPETLLGIVSFFLSPVVLFYGLFLFDSPISSSRVAAACWYAVKMTLFNLPVVLPLFVVAKLLAYLFTKIVSFNFAVGLVLFLILCVPFYCASLITLYIKNIHEHFARYFFNLG